MHELLMTSCPPQFLSLCELQRTANLWTIRCGLQLQIKKRVKYLALLITLFLSKYHDQDLQPSVPKDLVPVAT